MAGINVCERFLMVSVYFVDEVGTFGLRFRNVAISNDLAQPVQVANQSPQINQKRHFYHIKGRMSAFVAVDCNTHFRSCFC